MKPILPVDLEKHSTLRKEIGPLEDNLIDRLDYIITDISRITSFRFSNWRIPTLEILYEEGHPIIKMSHFEWENRHNYVDHDPMIFIEGKLWDLDKTIPRRWLYERFETELRTGKQLYREHIKDNKKRADAIKAKLTKKELKLLGLT